MESHANNKVLIYRKGVHSIQWCSIVIFTMNIYKSLWPGTGSSGNESKVPWTVFHTILRGKRPRLIHYNIWKMFCSARADLLITGAKTPACRMFQRMANLQSAALSAISWASEQTCCGGGRWSTLGRRRGLNVHGSAQECCPSRITHGVTERNDPHSRHTKRSTRYSCVRAFMQALDPSCEPVCSTPFVVHSQTAKHTAKRMHKPAAREALDHTILHNAAIKAPSYQGDLYPCFVHNFKCHGLAAVQCCQPRPVVVNSKNSINALIAILQWLCNSLFYRSNHCAQFFLAEFQHFDFLGGISEVLDSV